MSLLEWSKSSVDYGRRLVDSAVEGARSGENDFLKEEPLAPYLGESVRLALAPAFIGACLGVVGGYLANGRRSTNRALASGLFGGAIGFGAGVVWESRQLSVSVASGAWRNIRKARDQHWFEKNPIDYA
jgi:hypothetical protein